MAKHRVLIANDTHVGSVWGLWPPNYKADHDRVLPPNEAQAILYKEWLEFQEAVSKRKYDTVVFLGDMIDGPGYRKRGREEMTPDLMDQVLAGDELLRPLLHAANPNEVYVISGTDYHSDVQQDTERELAKCLDAQYLGCGPHDFVFGDTTINMSHGEGGSYWYRGTKLDKIGFAMLLCIGGEGLFNAKHIVRGHYHFMAYLHYQHQSMYVSPCWQLQTDYMRKVDPLKMIPNIGALELSIENGEVSPYFFSYPHPPRPKTFVQGYSANLSETKKVRKLKRW